MAKKKNGPGGRHNQMIKPVKKLQDHLDRHHPTYHKKIIPRIINRNISSTDKPRIKIKPQSENGNIYLDCRDTDAIQSVWIVSQTDHVKNLTDAVERFCKKEGIRFIK